jgi:monovalent cation:H+ antiporter-2, CPA2 family
VSVGMLFDPTFLRAAPGRVIAVLALIILGNGVAGLLLVLVRGYPLRTGLIVAAGLAQIGEFSFIVAGLGRTLGLLPEEGYQLVLAGALLSIVLNPLLFRAVDPLEAWLSRHPRLVPLRPQRMDTLAPSSNDSEEARLRDHAVICGYGRVGSEIGQLLASRGFPFVVIDQNRRWVEELRRRGITAIYGDAGHAEALEEAALDHAKVLLIAIPDPLAARRIVDHARERHPQLDIVARTHSEREWVYLSERVSEAVLGEREAAIEMARFTLRRFGVGDEEIQAAAQALRGQAGREQPAAALPATE